MKVRITSIIAIVLFSASIVVGLILLGREQDIRNKAASGSDCTQADDCILLEDPGDIGSYTASKNIRYIDITSRYYNRYNPGESDDCYQVEINANQLAWERIGDGPDCKDVSNIQIWIDNDSSQPSPTTTPTSSPSPIPSDSPTLGCSLTAETGQVLVNFNTARLRADASQASSLAGPFTVNLEPGNYKVILQSSDIHPEDESQAQEQFRIRLTTGSGQTVANSNPISDLEDGQYTLTQTVNDNLVLNTSITKIEVYHSAYPSSSSNSINAECAILERVVSPIGASCNDIKVFDDQWNRIESQDFNKLKDSDTIRITVSATTSQGVVEKARFSINGQLTEEVIQKRPGTNEFYYQYKIPQGMQKLELNAEVYHSTIGWF